MMKVNIVQRSGWLSYVIDFFVQSFDLFIIKSIVGYC